MEMYLTWVLHRMQQRQTIDVLDCGHSKVLHLMISLHYSEDKSTHRKLHLEVHTCVFFSLI